MKTIGTLEYNRHMNDAVFHPGKTVDQVAREFYPGKRVDRQGEDVNRQSTRAGQQYCPIFRVDGFEASLVEVRE